MKGTTNDKRNLVRRNRSHHSRVCNHHNGGGWLCRIAGRDIKIGRSQANASRHDSLSTISTLGIDEGSVTAEFAVILPAVILILFVALQILSFQSSRVGLIELAAESAREVTRGEEASLVESLIRDSMLKPVPAWKILHKEFELCVQLTQKRSLLGIGFIDLVEVQCARKSGL
jgi:hypothetical protein